MKTSLFDFRLPPERIATRPIQPRDAARLLRVAPQVLHDWHMGDLPELLNPGDILVFNDTKVIPARLIGMRGDAKVEVTLHKNLGDLIWQAFAKPAKRLKVGDVFTVAPDFTAAVLEKNEAGEVTLQFSGSTQEFFAKLKKYGHMPLPPYMKREDNAEDKYDYQTVYAQHEGAVAAPTAGLHFTPELLKKLEDKGIKRAFVTLHVGAGTFLPVKAEDTEGHKMHSELAIISPETAGAINAVKKAGGRVVAVGTTSLRVLESAADAQGMVHPYNQETDIFITPGYKFKAVDMLLTNFHLPKSTLFMLVCAFAGMENMQQAYAHAIAGGYRFYSYGDGCLLEKTKFS